MGIENKRNCRPKSKLHQQVTLNTNGQNIQKLKHTDYQNVFKNKAPNDNDMLLIKNPL